MSIKLDCQHNLSDDDVGKCCKHGYIFACEEDCPDYVNFFGYDINGKKKGAD